MDFLFTPWRYAYVSSSPAKAECVLCRLGACDPDRDADAFVVARADHNYLVLNLYPYNTAHLMVVPYRHAARLSALEQVSRREMFDLATRAEEVLEEVYRPHGINIGMNLGACAGAGIADHLHVHVVPRWSGDTSFMTVLGETRVLPENLAESWRKLRERF